MEGTNSRRSSTRREDSRRRRQIRLMKLEKRRRKKKVCMGVGWGGAWAVQKTKKTKPSHTRASRSFTHTHLTLDSPETHTQKTAGLSLHL